MVSTTLKILPRDLTPAQAARVMGKSRDFVMALIKAGELEARDEKSPEAERPRYRISPDAIDAWRRRRTASVYVAPKRTAQHVPQLTGVLSERRAARRARSRPADAQGRNP